MATTPPIMRIFHTLIEGSFSPSSRSLRTTDCLQPWRSDLACCVPLPARGLRFLATRTTRLSGRLALIQSSWVAIAAGSCSRQARSALYIGEYISTSPKQSCEPCAMTASPPCGCPCFRLARGYPSLAPLSRSVRLIASLRWLLLKSCDLHS